MNIKSLLNLTIDLIGKPSATASILSKESKGAPALLKEIALPYLIAIIAAEFIGHVMFGTYMFRDSLSFIINELTPTLAMMVVSGATFTLLLLSGLLPKLAPLFNLCGLYSYYLLWCMLKAEYSDSDSKKVRNATITSIVIMILLHWALVGCENLIFN